jgi:D-glycero-D-manno-heptose 1,7-bisphosphate phosphatase
VSGADRQRRCAAFIDRDGVINEERHYVHRVEDFVLLAGALNGMLRLQEAGYLLIVVTNQAGIGHGLYSTEQFEALTAHMMRLTQAAGVDVKAVYHCPHHPQAAVDRYRMACECRKPAPGMLLTAARDFALDLSCSVMIGDKRSDIEAGRAAGVGRCVLVTSGHEVTHADRQAASFCTPDLDTAAVALVEGVSS